MQRASAEQKAEQGDARAATGRHSPLHPPTPTPLSSLYVFAAPPSLSHLLISFPPGRGSGWARGAAWRVRVRDCDEGPLAEDHWVCTIILTTKALSKKRI